MTDDTTDWTDLREFKSVDLTQSFVLSWSTESESLLVDVDLFLCPDHTFFEKPRPAEKACFRPAYIEFRWCTRVAMDGDSKAQSVASAIKTLRNGQISGFKRIGEGQYEISGEFGVVHILGERPMVRLKSHYV